MCQIAVDLMHVGGYKVESGNTGCRLAPFFSGKAILSAGSDSAEAVEAMPPEGMRVHFELRANSRDIEVLIRLLSI